jgi:hypothetical protein
MCVFEDERLPDTSAVGNLVAPADMVGWLTMLSRLGYLRLPQLRQDVRASLCYIVRVELQEIYGVGERSDVSVPVTATCRSAIVSRCVQPLSP